MCGLGMVSDMTMTVGVVSDVAITLSLVSVDCD